MRLLFDIFVQTLRTLWAHKLRSFLTMFGIAWGVGSLLLLVGLGEGFRSGQHRQLADLGDNIMFIFGARTPVIPGNMNSGRFYQLTYGDYFAIRDEARIVGAVSPVIGRGDVRAVSDFNSLAGGVTGTSASYNHIRTMPIEVGRWFTEEDDNERRHVAIIGDEAARQLFPGKPVVGGSILLNGTRFEVIGKLRRIGREGNNGTNLRVFIPIQTMFTLSPMRGEMQRRAVGYLNYKPRTRGEHEQAKLEVHRIIARRHGFDASVKEAFEDEDTVADEETIGKIWDAMDYFLGSVGAVTLALGAIGIVNIMLVAVSERTREIGLRKAVGATRRNILTQFFLEGAFLTLLSGGIGLGATLGLMALMTNVQLPEGFDPPHIVPASAAVAILSLAVAGTFAALYPARRAALLTPVEALRHEA